jgi:hypothetical protein
MLEEGRKRFSPHNVRNWGAHRHDVLSRKRCTDNKNEFD